MQIGTRSTQQNSTGWIRTWPWLVAMLLLQLAWLGAIFHTKATLDNQLLSVVALWSVLSLFLAAGLAGRMGQGFRLGPESGQIWLLLSTALAICLVYSFLQRPWPDEIRWSSHALLVKQDGLIGLWQAAYQGKVDSAMNAPLPVILLGYLMRILPAGLGYERLLGVVAATGLVWTTYLNGRRLYDHATGLTAGWLLVATPYFARIGASVLNDMWVSFFFGLALYWAMSLTRRPSWGCAILLGLALGLGLLSKYTMVLAVPLLFALPWLWAGGWPVLPWLLASLAIGAAVFAPWVVLVYDSGLAAAQSKQISGYALNWVRHWRPNRWVRESLLTRFPSALGLYQFPLLVLGGFTLRPLRSRSDLLVVVWLAAVFLPVTFTTPDPRYFLPAFPAVGLAIARGLRLMPRGGALLIYSLLLALGAWYLFMDWQRAAGLITN